MAESECELRGEGAAGTGRTAGNFRANADNRGRQVRRGAGEGLQGRPSSAGKGNRGKEAEGQERREFGRETMQAGEKRRKEGKRSERVLNGRWMAAWGGGDVSDPTWRGPPFRASQVSPEVNFHLMTTSATCPARRTPQQARPCTAPPPFPPHSLFLHLPLSLHSSTSSFTY